jgi:hypothetical protein
VQVERVRDATDAEAARGAHARGDIEVAAAAAEVLEADADVQTRAAAPQIRRRDRRILDRLPAHLQQHALLRIHARRLAFGDAEERRLEPVDPVDERAVHVGERRIIEARVAERPRERQPLDRNRRDGVAARGEQ